MLTLPLEISCYGYQYQLTFYLEHTAADQCVDLVRCSQFCERVGSADTCSCRTGYVLASDGVTCNGKSGRQWEAMVNQGGNGEVMVR